jgi:hypothetical protein
MILGRLSVVNSHIKRNIDELMILATMAKIQYDNNPDLTSVDLQVIQALERSTNDLSENSNITEIKDYLSNYEGESLDGLVNNVKGILHEIQFVEFENNDGDSILASIFSDTNHAVFDVRVMNAETKEYEDLQLKATDNESYVMDWMEKNDGTILVTEELAQKMGLPSSGISNEQLKIDVDTFVDKMLQADDTFLDYVPLLGSISVAIIVYELWKRYKNQEITKEQFQTLTLMATGSKFAMYAIMAILFSTPVVSTITIVAILLKVIDDFSIKRDRKVNNIELDGFKRVALQT